MLKAQPKSILLVFDKFKDSLSAKKVCETVQRALYSHFGEDSILVRDMPISDGGDGFVDCMHQILKGQSDAIERKQLTICDPLMREVTSEFLLDKATRTAYIEVANSAGLPMLAREERDPKYASSIVSDYF